MDIFKIPTYYYHRFFTKLATKMLGNFWSDDIYLINNFRKQIENRTITF